MEFDANFSQPASKKQNADQTDQTRQTWRGGEGGNAPNRRRAQYICEGQVM